MICDKHSDEEVDSSSRKYVTKYVRNNGTYFLRQRDGILKGCEEIRVGGQWL